MTLVELRYIVALAAEGNFSRAAERCAVSQPTLSVAIARIESELGVQLFDRSKGFVSPSPVGAEIVRQARLALHEADKIRDIALHGRNQLAGSLRLGVIHTVGPYLLPPLIVELKRLADEANTLQVRVKSMANGEAKWALDKERKKAWGAYFELKDQTVLSFSHPFAITSHKSQGSTYRAAFVDVGDLETYSRHALYVAVTRPREELVLGGGK